MMVADNFNPLRKESLLLGWPASIFWTVRIFRSTSSASFSWVILRAIRSRRTLRPKALICAACFDSSGIRLIEAHFALDDHGTMGRKWIHAQFRDEHHSGRIYSPGLRLSFVRFGLKLGIQTYENYKTSENHTQFYRRCAGKIKQSLVEPFVHETGTNLFSDVCIHYGRIHFFGADGANSVIIQQRQRFVSARGPGFGQRRQFLRDNLERRRC